MNSIKRTVWRAAGLLGLVAIFALPASADQQILDDLIVDGSACVGFDCVNGESFGFDTIRIKENNLRIHAQDTSNSASFPTVDWRLTFNDSSNGGRNRFSVECVDQSRESFTIEGCAPSHSLYVDDGGRIGFGTNNPVTDLHVVSGNTPTLRLEQDGSSGFTPQTWDVAGNEANFFVRDATNGSKLVLRLEPGAPDASIYVNSDGTVGHGHNNPGEELHVRRTVNSGNVTVKVESTQARPSRLLLVNTASDWRFSNGSTGLLTIADAISGGTNEFTLDNAGALTIAGAITTGGGTCGGGCDLVFSSDYEVESIKDHAEAMWQSGHLPAVGPTPENQPFNLSDKTGRMLHELEKAHIYIEQLHDRLAALEAKIAADEAAGSVE